MLRYAVLAAFVVVPFVTESASAGSYRLDGCSAAVDEAVRSSGINSADIARIDVIPQREGTDRGSVVGLEVWIGMKSCTGNVILNLDARTCRMRDAFTRGDCSVPGLPNY